MYASGLNSQGSRHQYSSFLEHIYQVLKIYVEQTRSEGVMMVALCSGLQLWVMAGMFINSYSAPITCDAGTYVVGQPAFVTCNFRTNISASHLSFNVARYPSVTETAGAGIDVLACHWSKIQQRHDCTVANGFTFDNVITDQVTVRIAETEEKFEGLYRCFYVPSQGEEVHACDFIITIKSIVTPENTSNNTHTDPPTDEGDTLLIAILSVTAAVLLFLLPVMFYFIYQKNRCVNTRFCRQTDESLPLISLEEKQRENLLKPFNLSKKNLMEIRNKMDQEMGRALNNSSPSKKSDTTGTEVDLKMSSISCPLLTEQATGAVLVVHFGRTHIIVSDVKLRRFGISVCATATYEITKKSTATQLFEHIIHLIDVFVCDHVSDAETRVAVLVIPFSCNQTSLEKATLNKWTQEFNCGGATALDLHEMLREALKSKPIGKKPCSVKFEAIVNDAVNTIMSVAYQNPKCKIGLVAGDGFNACYIDRWSQDDAENAKDEQKNKEIYNTEMGALGENGCLEGFRTEYDKELDKGSIAPGQHILEKMVSWVYIGEIVRLVLTGLREKDLLLPHWRLGCDLFQKSCLTADLVAEIDGDTEEPYAETQRILKDFSVEECSDEDLKIVRYVCGLVTDRAAKLAGAVLASLINHLDKPGVIVVVDGELNRKLPRFGELLYSTANELVTSKLQDKFYLVSSFRPATTIGAARIAQASLNQKRTSTASES